MTEIETVKEWLEDMALSIENQDEPSTDYYDFFVQEPELALTILQLLTAMNEQQIDEARAYYSACIFGFDVCVAQLQAAFENGNKHAEKVIQQVMTFIADLIKTGTHQLTFWLPILNAFYNVHVELSPVLKAAYLDLVDAEDEQVVFGGDDSHLQSIRELIQELSDLTVFDIAENFFAQSYAMPPEFFCDLVLDLYHVEEGKEIGLLALLHPQYEVREIVVSTLDSLFDQVVLSSQALSRLQAIKAWYPETYHAQFTRWIKAQRKKEVVFHQKTPAKIISIRATEVDGGGAQGIFIHLKYGRSYRLCGMLFKQELGIKDAWITSKMTRQEVDAYNEEVFHETVTLREVDLAYLESMTNHFLAITLEHGGMPDLHLLEIQEELGLHFIPKHVDILAVIDQLSVQVTPFTEAALEASLMRSKTWPKTKRFTESWFLENAQIDKLVNRCCSFIDGVKVCRLADAKDAVFVYELEQHRARWIFHFIWIALWLKAHARKNEKAWQDAFFIAYAIHHQKPLKEIPIMREICHQSVINSIETMQDRKTHLSQE